MSEWAYKFTSKKRSNLDTTRLADEFGFLARSAHKRMKSGDSGGVINNVTRVVPGDVLHAYYVGKKGPRAVGSFRVIDPESCGERFARVWPAKAAALAQAREIEGNRGLFELLRKKPASGEGYLTDPLLGVFTGWIVQRIADRVPPRFESVDFRGRNTLVRVDVGPLPHGQPVDELLSRVVHDLDVMGGKPCIRGTRVTVGTILGLLASGQSFEMILADFPYLQEIDVRAALAYAAWRTQEREIPLEAA